jgi:hypothetical protein
MIDAGLEAKVDIVSVDNVAQTLLDEAFLMGKKVGDARIAYAVATLENSLDIKTISLTVAEYFRGKRGCRRPKLNYLGPRNRKFCFHDTLHHKIPIFMARMYYGIRGDAKMRKGRKRWQL